MPLRLWGCGWTPAFVPESDLQTSNQLIGDMSIKDRIGVSSLFPPLHSRTIETWSTICFYKCACGNASWLEITYILSFQATYIKLYSMFNLMADCIWQTSPFQLFIHPVWVPGGDSTCTDVRVYQPTLPTGFSCFRHSDTLRWSCCTVYNGFQCDWDCIDLRSHQPFSAG